MWFPLYSLEASGLKEKGGEGDPHVGYWGTVPVQRGSMSASVADGWNSSQGQDNGSVGSEVPEGPGRRLKSPGRRHSSEQLGLHGLADAEGQGTGRQGIGDLTALFCPYSWSSEQTA